MRLRFGDCLLDTERRELRRAARVVPLQPKAFRLLEILATRRPAVVERPELRRLLWPEVEAGGTPLARLVSEIRAAIGDRARAPRFIRTVHRVGYAFCGAVTEETERPPLRGTFALEWGERLVTLRPGENVIGRTTGASISAASPRVSRRHARIVVTEERAVLEDLGSRNGTFVNGRRVDVPTELRHGDRIGIDPVQLVFRASSQEETEE